MPLRDPPRRRGGGFRWTCLPLLLAFTLPALAGESRFGESVPGLVPRPVAPKLLSSGRPPDSHLTFSIDGDQVCWSAPLADGSQETILCARFDGLDLEEPAEAPFVTEREGAGPSFSDDGLTVYFRTRRNLFGPKSISGIAAVRREPGGWGHPLIIASTFDSTRTAGQPTIARGGNIYFSGRLYNDRFPKIYLVEFANGEYRQPVALPQSINRPGALDPFVDPDERFLLFAAIGRPDGQGITDLYISRRTKDGDWGEPVNLGPEVNTEYFERFPSLSRDGRYLFFIRCVGNRYPGEDLSYYWVDAAVLDRDTAAGPWLENR